MPLRFSIVTTCKGRLHHLQRSLPTFLAQPDAEVIVVDYDCPQGTADWVATHCPAARVEIVRPAPVFNLSRARNIGARRARAPWLLFCDADNLLPPDFTIALAAYLAPKVFVRPFRQTPRGAVAVPFPLACETAVYHALGGFDDAIEGWGAEDWEFADRLQRAGISQRVYPVSLVAFIEHENAARTEFYEDAMQVSRLVNHYYARIKARYTQTRGHGLSDDQRYAVHRQVREAVRAALADSPQDTAYDITVPGVEPPWTARLRASEARALFAQTALT